MNQRPPLHDAHLRARVLEAARRTSSPTRAELRRRRGWLVPLAAAGMATSLLVAGGPGHAAGRPGAISAWIIAGLVGLAIAATGLALPPLRSMLPPPAWLLLAVAAGVPLAVAAWLVSWHTAYDDPFTRFGFICFSLTVAASLLPFLALLGFTPRFDPVRPRLTGAALGASAGAWGAVVVVAWCPLAEPAHVVVGHALPLLVLAAVGALVGGRRLRLRRP